MMFLIMLTATTVMLFILMAHCCRPQPKAFHLWQFERSSSDFTVRGGVFDVMMMMLVVVMMKMMLMLACFGGCELEILGKRRFVCRRRSGTLLRKKRVT